ncbi:MAG TPA: hypothetical protein VE998_11575, partial [Terriglobales bacterium]|nr:hypothetical protein [Terriglobales bacterium]
ELHIEQAVKLEPANPDLLYSKALVQSFAGDDAGAIATLKEAIGKGAQPFMARAEPDFARLRSNSEFQAVVAASPAAK